MTFEEARDILVLHNKWRRDDHIPNKYEMVNPTNLGIDALSDRISSLKCVDDNYADYSAQLNLPF